MPSEKILVVEDDANIAELIELSLKKNGYRVSRSESAEGALALFQKEAFDLVLLDIMLPGMDGHDFCKILRASPKGARIPVIMLTARSEDADIVSGLELGADDYMTKPFSPRVLLARIKARLRAPQDSGAKGTLSYMGIELDENSREARIDSRKAEFTANEFEIMKLFIANPGRVYTRDDIIGHLHGPGYAVTDRAIDVQLAGLRKKLGKKSELIETVRGVGYKFRKG